LQLNRINSREKLAQISFLAAGLPAETRRLLVDEDYFRSKARSFTTAKTFLSSDTYNRLKIIANFKERDEAMQFVKSLADLSQILAEKTLNPAKLALLSDCLDGLSRNGSLKAQLTHLAVNF
jgi:hypothetical protein